MKLMYIECNMGAAGDMLLSALASVIGDPEETERRLNGLGIPGVSYEIKPSVKCGITGLHTEVTVNGEHEHEHMHEHHEHHVHEHHHHHAGMHEITHIINDLKVSEKVKNDAIAVYKLIAEAESSVHGCDISEIHFHEVGTMDAVADVVGVCMLMDEIAPDKVIVSPVNTGHGQVRCAHGILPVPAPATAYILRDIPIYSGSTEGELCTPTGAALLRYFADGFEYMPMMKVSASGCGMGTKDFEQANCVRVMLGETEAKSDSISVLCCNIDDMNGEDIGFAAGRLFAEGALDVYTVPAGMKKSRPGIILYCICKEFDTERFAQLIFRYTSTLGIRLHRSERYVLEREEATASTRYGDVRYKRSFGYGVERIKPEYEDLRGIAEKQGCPVSRIRKEVEEDIRSE